MCDLLRCYEEPDARWAAELSARHDGITALLYETATPL